MTENILPLYYWPYDRCHIKPDVCIPIKFCQKLRDFLTTEFRVLSDNKETFLFRDCHGNEMCVMFKDGIAYFSDEIFVADDGTPSMAEFIRLISKPGEDIEIQFARYHIQLVRNGMQRYLDEVAIPQFAAYKQSMT